MTRKYAVQFAHAPLARRPYPVVCDEEGAVLNSIFNNFSNLIGFCHKFEAGKIDVFWKEAITNPEKVIGLHPIVTYEEGSWSTLECTVEGVNTYED